MRIKLPTSAKIVALHLLIQLSTATVVLAYISKQLEQSFTREAIETNRTLLGNAASMIELSGADRAQEIVAILNKESAQHGYALRLIASSAPAPSSPPASLLPQKEVRTRLAVSERVSLEAVNDMREARQFSKVVAIAFIGVMLLGIEAGALLAYFLLRSTRHRIMQIADVADDVGRGNLNRRLEVAQSNSPFDRLGNVLNAMFARLEGVMAELRAITDAIAHDVRSPLMRMRVHAEEALASQRMGEARPSLLKVLKEAEMALRITSVAMEISRAEAGIDRSDFVEVDMAALVQDLVDAYEPTAASQGIRLTFSAHDDASIVFGHEQLLGQVVANLIDNVFRHAMHGGSCDLTIDRIGGYVRLQVADRGPGVPAEDQERALCRFVKLNASRSSPGAGLGLALIDAVVRLHQGAIRLEDNKPGLRVIIALPTSDQSS
jgi:signal transduction histidine kinase